MGQGYSMTALSAVAVTINVPELADLVHEKTLASARFMKSIRARNKQGYVFVKAVQKPYTNFDVQPYVKHLARERKVLASIPNALGSQRIIQAGNAGYLVRQYMYSSVYDRLSTRPFLEDIERKWLAFQLLCAVRDCHAHDVFHGDIKTENLLVTSWNWLYLSDFSASYKPTTLPEDNPADFFFYFDTSGRRICYVAPERFHNGISDQSPTELNWAMDMFSVGCTVAELFLEGPIFTLSQIFKYRTGDYSPEHTHIKKIEDFEVRAMILNLIDLNPEKRYSAEQILTFYKGKIFPEYFYASLHQYMQDLTEAIGDSRLISLEVESLVQTDIKIDKVYQDIDKIAYFLTPDPPSSDTRSEKRTRSSSKPEKGSTVVSRLRNYSETTDSTLLFLSLISSCIRSTARASARLKACDLLVQFAQRLPDEAKLDRVLPYIVGLLIDQSDIVKVGALKGVTAILEQIETVSPINAYLFPEYILPKLKLFLTSHQNQPTELVRAAYASCLASLALSSARMLDMVQAIRADGRIAALSNNELAPDALYHGLYDVARAELVPFFEEATTSLISDPMTSVRRALLGSISQLCVFFGSTRSSDVILSHLNTYLNDKDWMLRCSFLETLVGVGLYVGTSSLERFILPMMIGSLTDTETFVVEKALRSLSRMAALGLFQKSTLWDLAGIASRYLVHPSLWVREAAVQFIVRSSQYLSPADKYCIIMPLLQPFLKTEILDLTEEQVLDNLKRPLLKPIVDGALLWAAKKQNGHFWSAAGRDGVYSISGTGVVSVPVNTNRRLATRIPPSQRDKDDQIALEGLRNFGMTADDEVKLLALREYILRVATRRNEDQAAEADPVLNGIIPLTRIGVTPQNVFFDQKQPRREIRQTEARTRSRTRGINHTLTDALLDASTNLNETPDQQSRLDSISSRPLPVSSSPSTGGMTEPSPSSDRQNLRVQGLKSGESRRASSVGGRHALLDSERLSAQDGLRHRNSAISLLSRAETIKADAEISTTQETAFARLDRQAYKRDPTMPASNLVAAEAFHSSRSKSPVSQTPATAAYEANHSYIGHDPNVLKLLNHHLIDNFPVDLDFFGPKLVHLDTAVPLKRFDNHPADLKSDTAGETSNFHSDPWRPTGQLLVQYAEHTAAINRVVAAPDHAFFVSASDDGTCKVWDSTRLEKNVSPRSRCTHQHAQGAKVKSLCFVQDTHTFISGADDGSIHAVKIEYRKVDGGDNAKYGKPTLVRDYQIPAAGGSRFDESGVEERPLEYAVWLQHYRSPTSHSILVVATSQCRILLIDLKNMEIIHAMENPVEHGTPVTFCIDKKQHWLLVGTTHGILDLWDLRFRLHLRALGIGGAGRGKRIDQLLLHPTKGRNRWVMVSCGGEISVWDLEKMVCREIMRPSTQAFDGDCSYEVWLPDEEPSEVALKRFAQTIDMDHTATEVGAKGLEVIRETEIRSGALRSSATMPVVGTLPVSSLHVFIDYLANVNQPSSPSKAVIIFSAGADRTIRYWDLGRMEQSFVVSGPMVNVVGGDGESASKARVRYETSWPTSLSLNGSIQLTEEKYSDRAGRSTGTETPRKSKEEGGTHSAGGTPSRNPASMTVTSGGGMSPSKSESKGVSRATRSSLISAAQQQLLRMHMDAITDMMVFRRPYGCIVSADRSGSIMVFY